jgi:hypothetical protein
MGERSMTRRIATAASFQGRFSISSVLIFYRFVLVSFKDSINDCQLACVSKTPS